MIEGNQMELANLQFSLALPCNKLPNLLDALVALKGINLSC